MLPEGVATSRRACFPNFSKFGNGQTATSRCLFIMQVTACGCRGACISKDEERLTKGRGFSESVKAKKTKTKQKHNKGYNRERQHGIRLENTSSRYLWLIMGKYGERTSTDRLALGYILSLVLPVTFGHTTVCRSPALGFSAAIHCFAVLPVTFGHTTVCCSPALAFSAAIHCFAVLRHSPSSQAAVVHWSALMSEPDRLFSLALYEACLCCIRR